MMDYLSDPWFLETRQKTFADAGALLDYRFDADNGSVPQIAQARAYAEHWEEMYRENMGLLFWGKPGNGKTFAAACIANALLEQKGSWEISVRMTTLGTVLNRLPGLSAQDKDWYLKDLIGCDLLILDDFGMERQTEYAREQVFHIIDSRYLARRPLIVTTNLSIQELKHPRDLAQQRIYDRILELCVPVCFSGESLRQKKAKEKLKHYRLLTEQSVPAAGNAAYTEAARRDPDDSPICSTEEDPGR